MSSGYRLAPPLAARLVGSLLVAVAALVLVLTVVTAVLRWSPWVVVGVGAGAVALVAVAAFAVRRIDVVSLDDDGYRVRLVRGAGVTSARWADATDARHRQPRRDRLPGDPAPGRWRDHDPGVRAGRRPGRVRRRRARPPAPRRGAPPAVTRFGGRPAVLVT